MALQEKFGVAGSHRKKGKHRRGACALDAHSLLRSASCPAMLGCCPFPLANDREAAALRRPRPSLKGPLPSTTTEILMALEHPFGPKRSGISGSAELSIELVRKFGQRCRVCVIAGDVVNLLRI